MARAPIFAWQEALLALDLRDESVKRSTVISVGSVLSWHFNKDLVAWPSAETLAREAGSKAGTVRSVIEVLEMHGLLRVDRRGPGAGARNTNRYHGLLLEDENGSPKDHSTRSETDSGSTVSRRGNGPPEGLKWVSTVSKTGPLGTPNSKEQQENSATPSNATIAELKRQHPDEWAEARNEVDRRIARGQRIDNPGAYAAPILKDLIEKKTEKGTAMRDKSVAEAAIDACPLCNSDGSIAWETADGLRSRKCSHDPADYPGFDVITRREQAPKLHKS